MPYTVQESLLYQVPCIVTDVGGCVELIKDGVNGYVVPLDMNFDINKIKNIPKCEEYDNKSLETWLNFLEYNGPKINKEKIIKRYEEEKDMKARVQALKKFENIIDAERGIKPKEGEEWITSLDRAEFLESKKVVKIIERIKEESPKIEKPKTEKSKEIKPKKTNTTKKNIAKEK